MKVIDSGEHRIVLVHDAHILIVNKSDMASGVSCIGGYVDCSMHMQTLLNTSIYGRLAMKCILDSVRL